MEDWHARGRRSRLTKALLAALVGWALLAGLVACGGARKGSSVSSATDMRAASHAASSSPSTLTQYPGQRRPMSAYEPPTHLPLKGDSDHDARTWDDGYRTPDNDEDPGLDHQPSDAREGYRDADDLDSLRVGIPESPANTRAIEALVRRYYAVAASGDGAKACAMMDRGFAESAPVAYGRFGPPYLRGGKTCAQIAMLEFKHDHSLISTKLVFTAVHEESPNRAYALFGSTTSPASFIGADRENGVWKIGSLLGRPEY